MYLRERQELRYFGQRGCYLIYKKSYQIKFSREGERLLEIKKINGIKFFRFNLKIMYFFMLMIKLKLFFFVLFIVVMFCLWWNEGKKDKKINWYIILVDNYQYKRREYLEDYFLVFKIIYFIFLLFLVVFLVIC